MKKKIIIPIIIMFSLLFLINSIYALSDLEWTALTPGTNTGIKFGTTNARSIAYGNGRWVAVGINGKESYSDDGINWNVLTAGNDTGIKFGTTDAYSIAYGNERWVAVGHSGNCRRS